MLDGLGVSPVTLLVAPEYHHTLRIDRDPVFVRGMEQRLAAGDEVVLHGYYHLDESPPPQTPRAWLERRLLTNREGEFAALDERAAHERLERGLDVMQQLHWPVYGFVAPAWQVSAGTRAALSLFTFAYTATRAQLFALPGWQAIDAPALTYSARSAWRRAVSNRVLAIQAKTWARKRIVRAALHPVDARHEAVMSDWQALIEHLLRDRKAVSKATAACGNATIHLQPFKSDCRQSTEKLRSLT
jgi:predicted deacetylase